MLLVSARQCSIGFDHFKVTLMSLCLSRDELTELCRTNRKARQLAFLRQNGIRHYLDAYGWPVVPRASIEGTKDSEQARKPWKSNKAID